MATSEKLKLFNKLIDAYKSAHYQKIGDVVQKEVSDLWTHMKSIHVDINSLKEACDTKVVELKAITSKRKGGFLEFWSKGHKKSKADHAGEIPTPECDKVVAPTVTD